MEAAIYSLAMLAVFVLAGAGVWLMVSGRDRKRGLLMLAAGLVIVMNVVIWTLPVPQAH